MLINCHPFSKCSQSPLDIAFKAVQKLLKRPVFNLFLPKQNGAKR
jgi:hypothetical protein